MVPGRIDDVLRPGPPKKNVEKPGEPAENDLHSCWAFHILYVGGIGGYMQLLSSRLRFRLRHHVW